ncbi:uncharacterized protein K460DRAFT_147221 [Cucurbitaria berberidis CBS 394.84]|uniref:Uncharacterized protein n=1 Tax=Cucurbitaria berberidis CBS 394.84 TaxID=1168544 RepID=A0A9P4L6Q7_9PLEO|nr:uncharacterized protein K460DRAFT_147221 [Cucurbitaria berberidis CBS 394.84]KAF1843544.1 hypothetical protein K460DRAFT_147221 [Cucurbitaria berberidis CBS 394.84]
MQAYHTTARRISLIYPQMKARPSSLLPRARGVRNVLVNVLCMTGIAVFLFAFAPAVASCSTLIARFSALVRKTSE